MYDYYTILQVDREASQEVIKAAYKKLAVEYHPDTSAHPNASEKFQQLSQAYKVLSHEGQRLMYDLSLIDTFQPLTTPGSNASSKKKRHPLYPFGTKSYEEVILPYLKYSRYLCRVSFVFCMFLFLDYYLPHQKSTERISSIETEVMSVTGKATGELVTMFHTDEGTSFSLPREQWNAFKKGQHVVIARTRITNTTLNATRPLQPHTAVREYGSIYSPKMFLVVILAFCSLMGGFIHPSPNGALSFGVASVLLLIVIYSFL